MWTPLSEQMGRTSAACSCSFGEPACGEEAAARRPRPSLAVGLGLEECHVVCMQLPAVPTAPPTRARGGRRTVRLSTLSAAHLPRRSLGCSGHLGARGQRSRRGRGRGCGLRWGVAAAPHLSCAALLILKAAPRELRAWGAAFGLYVLSTTGGFAKRFITHTHTHTHTTHTHTKKKSVKRDRDCIIWTRRRRKGNSACAV